MLGVNVLEKEMAHVKENYITNHCHYFSSR